jgi:predicted DCC family thiol-disulfide oxidoreductase YuxK
VKQDAQTTSQLSQQACRLVYEAECRLCASVKSKLERMEMGQTGTNVRFLAYQSEEARKALGHNYRPGRPEMAFLIRPSGEVLQGLEAFLPFVPNLPGGTLLLRWLRFSFAKQLAERGYRTIARHRYRWFGEVKPVR